MPWLSGASSCFLQPEMVFSLRVLRAGVTMAMKLDKWRWSEGKWGEKKKRKATFPCPLARNKGFLLEFLLIGPSNTQCYNPTHCSVKARSYKEKNYKLTTTQAIFQVFSSLPKLSAIVYFSELQILGFCILFRAFISNQRDS